MPLRGIGRQGASPPGANSGREEHCAWHESLVCRRFPSASQRGDSSVAAVSLQGAMNLDQASWWRSRRSLGVRGGPRLQLPCWHCILEITAGGLRRSNDTPRPEFGFAKLHLALVVRSRSGRHGVFVPECASRDFVQPVIHRRPAFHGIQTWRLRHTVQDGLSHLSQAGQRQNYQRPHAQLKQG